MIARVKKAFVENLPNLEWMDNETRAAALGKVSETNFIALNNLFIYLLLF